MGPPPWPDGGFAGVQKPFSGLPGTHLIKVAEVKEKRIDLNLLNVFYAVMIERSVTRAAERLSMTQPAVSNALGRLRYLFKDEIFVKSAGGIRPTERATAIWQSMRRPFEELRAIAIPSDFQPSKTTATFNIAITDTLLSRVVPLLGSRFVETAPSAKLNFHLHSNPGSMAAIEKDALDCAVGMFPNFSPNLMIEGIAVDDYVCVFRRGHPSLGQNISIDQFLAAKHVLVKQSFQQLGMVDAWMSLLGMERDIVVIVNASDHALRVAKTTDLVAAVPRSYVESSAHAAELQWTQLPFRHDGILYKLAWHERTDRDPARAWLRGMVKDAVRLSLRGPLGSGDLVRDPALASVPGPSRPGGQRLPGYLEM